jgi:hypothetical protein
MSEQVAAPTPQRWSAKRKAEIVGAVSRGALTLESARETYGLSREEFLSWQDSLETLGVAGLRVYAQERRTSPRRAIDEPATAIFNAHSRVACTIRDIGEHGARLEFKTTATPSGKFVLQCAKSRRSSWVRVVYRNGRTVGLRFEAPPSADATVEPASGAWLLGEE